MSRLALVPVFAVALSIPLAARQAPPPSQVVQSPQDAAPAQPTVFRSGASMVALNVTVLDGRKLVSGLCREDFEVYEDGVQQQVHFFESRTVPLDIILLLDTSASMSDKMEVVHHAARGFMKMLRPGDRGAVVAFSDSVNVIQPLTADSKAIADAIEATRASGATSLHNAIYIALKQFGRGAKSSDEVRRQAIAVLSDGEDTASVVSFDDVMALARKTGVNIYTIGLHSQYVQARAQSERRYFSQSDYALKSLAQETGAQSFFPNTVNELKNVYDAIADELSAQYSIGYSPSNARPDGRFRRIVVRVASNPAFKPRSRAGYTADVPSRVTAGVPQR